MMCHGVSMTAETTYDASLPTMIFHLKQVDAYFILPTNLFLLPPTVISCIVNIYSCIISSNNYSQNTFVWSKEIICNWLISLKAYLTNIYCKLPEQHLPYIIMFFRWIKNGNSQKLFLSLIMGAVFTIFKGFKRTLIMSLSVQDFTEV